MRTVVRPPYVTMSRVAGTQAASGKSKLMSGSAGATEVHGAQNVGLCDVGLCDNNCFQWSSWCNHRHLFMD